MGNLEGALAAWQSGEIEPPPVTRLVGIELISYGEGVSKMRMKADDRHFNPTGIVHDGILCDLADAAMGVAIASTMEKDESFSTAELHTYYFAPVRQEMLTAVGKTVRRGRRTAYAECEIYDGAGHMVARASSMCLIERADTGDNAEA
jgi:uncharacterized protein (TIGR00369 family)